MKKEYRICKRCIMDTTDPNIEFDENGFCNHCKNYDARSKKELFHGEEGKKILARLVGKIKQDGKGKEYDCVVGVSGGVDSTMVALMSKELGLRPLAVHIDNGWNSELSVNNIEKILRKLDIDLYTYVIEWEEFKDLQLAFLKASVPNIEIPTDHAIFAALFDIANEKGIKYIMSGGNLETESIMPDSWGYDWRDYKHIDGIHKIFGKVKFKSYPRASLSKFIYYLFLKKIKVVRILNLTIYDKKKSIEKLQNELGWVSYNAKHFESIFTRFFQGYILPKKFSFDKRRAHFSSLICSRQMTRIEALKEMENDPYPEDLFREDKKFVLKKLGLTEEEFEQIMHLPIKDHRQYPSNHFLFRGNLNIIDFIKRIGAR